VTPRIRKHWIRIYERRTGYGLYVGTPSAGLTRQPLDHESRLVSRSYIAAQRRLDKVLGTKRVPWSMTFRLDDPRSSPVVAYGSHMELTAEQGQSGIIFLHAVELSHPDLLHACVDGMVTFLSNAGIRELRRVVLDAATDKTDGGSAAALIASQLEDLVAECPADEGWRPGGRLSIKSIEQDCAGAASLAWLTFALQQTRVMAPWEVYDLLRDGSNVITATSSPYADHLRASDIQRESLWHYLGEAAGAETPISPPPEQENPPPAGPADVLVEFPSGPASEPDKPARAAEEPKPRRAARATFKALAPFAPWILMGCLVLLFIYTSNRQHERLLKALNQLTVGIAPSPTVASTPSGGGTSSSQSGQQSRPESQTNPQLLLLIAELFSPDRGVRYAAIGRLRLDKASHGELILPAIEYARQRQDNLDGLENTLIVFEAIDPVILRNHRDLILAFTSDIQGRHPRIDYMATRLASSLNAP
jgi:hypothetical protein